METKSESSDYPQSDNLPKSKSKSSSSNPRIFPESSGINLGGQASHSVKNNFVQFSIYLNSSNPLPILRFLYPIFPSVRLTTDKSHIFFVFPYRYYTGQDYLVADLVHQVSALFPSVFITCSSNEGEYLFNILPHQTVQIVNFRSETNRLWFFQGSLWLLPDPQNPASFPLIQCIDDVYSVLTDNNSCCHRLEMPKIQSLGLACTQHFTVPSECLQYLAGAGSGNQSPLQDFLMQLIQYQRHSIHPVESSLKSHPGDLQPDQVAVLSSDSPSNSSVVFPTDFFIQWKTLYSKQDIYSAIQSFCSFLSSTRSPYPQSPKQFINSQRDLLTYLPNKSTKPLDQIMNFKGLKLDLFDLEDETDHYNHWEDWFDDSIANPPLSFPPHHSGN